MLMPKLWMPIDTPTTASGERLITPSSRRALNTGTNTTPPPVPEVLAMIAPITPTPGRNHNFASSAGSAGASAHSAA